MEQAAKNLFENRIKNPFVGHSLKAMSAKYLKQAKGPAKLAVRDIFQWTKGDCQKLKIEIKDDSDTCHTFKRHSLLKIKIGNNLKI